MGSNIAPFIGRVVAIPAKVSACTFFVWGILLTAHSLNLSKLACTFEMYWAMRSSLAPYSPWICLTTSWESLHISNFVIDKMRAKVNLTKITSYSASLLETRNPSQIAYSSCSLVGDCKRRPILDLRALDAQSMWSIHHPSSRESTIWDGFWGSSAIKPTMTYPFISSLGWYLIPYSLTSIVHLSILPDRSSLCKMLLSGWFVSIVT